ncbi:MAG: response regulator [Flavobacteriaceae bacterium]|nr:response regulator [Flavobacteriaceae bacterium]
MQSISLYGQDQKKIDSLEAIINKSSSQLEKVNAFIALSDMLIHKDKKESEENLLEALNLIKDKNQFKILTNLYHKLGVINYKKENDDVAMKYFIKSDSLSNIHNIINEDLVQTKFFQSQILKFTFTEKGIQKSKEYLDEMLDYTRILKDSMLINWGYQKMGGYYGVMSELKDKKKNLDSAMYYYVKAKDFFERNNHYKELITTLWSVASMEEDMGNFKEAKKYQDQRISTLKYINDSPEKGIVYKSVGDFYTIIKKPREGLNYLKKARQLFEKYGYPTAYDKSEMYKYQSQAYFQLEEYKKAYTFKNLELRLKDSINKVSNKQKALELETKYQTKQKEQEITLLTSENKLVLQQKKNQRNILLGTVSLTALTGLFFFFQYRNRKKTNKKLRELDKLKSTFFANISHEFRTPLTLISGPIQQLIKKDNLQEDERKNLQTMQVNSQRLISLVDQLLDLSKIEAGSLALQVSNNKLIHFVGTLVDSYHFIIEEKNITFIRHINPSELETWYDKTIIEKIVLNLLTNAQKYTPKNGSIVCSANVHDDRFIFEIKNSGKGIHERDLKKIFDRFYQVTNNQHGVGIGLALIKELVTLHKGTIKVTSTPNEWTTFTVELPIDKHTFQDNISEKIIDLDPEKNNDIVQELFHSETNLSEKETLENDLPILLLVEDNTEVRNYIYSIFKDNYSIIQATNGEEGILIAIEEIPDLIISDIMMPVKNGIELCNTLKTDERTSHIPIILLTAKVGEENELEGIKTGADDYITKPFNQELLALKVEKYIEVRKKMQDRYSQELVLKPTDITLNSTDEIFLGKVQEVIDSKIIESTFSIDKFCSSVGMSRMQLHRKLRALTGQTTSEFIRTQRLKLAADLLINSDVNISQIGYSVGFNNPAYFSKCFKEIYHCSPTEYANKKG